MPTIYNINAIDEIRRRNAVQPHRMKLFRNALFKSNLDWNDALAVLPDSVQADFERHIEFSCLDVLERHDSDLDGASKLIFKTHDGHLIESVVLRPQTGRTSVCISSQVGCACYCSFCATGQMGFTRNLTKDEILDQVTQAGRLARAEDRRIRNVVFMGMGEPLLNLEPVFDSLAHLLNPAFHNLEPSRITVSTVGIPDGMLRLAEQFPAVNMALSLHSARQDVREKLMPQARRFPLDQLRSALLRVSENGKVMIEYLMLDGVNDGDEDLSALGSYLQGVPVHINLIPFNDFSGCSLRGAGRERSVFFSDELKQMGFDVTLRYSMGADIAAACGQLVQHKRSQP